MGVRDRLAHAWNAFFNEEEKGYQTTAWTMGPGYGMRQDRNRSRVINERSILSSVLTRIAVDVASVEIKHVRLDEEDRYLAEIKSGLNNCLTSEANVDQGGTQFRQDIVSTMLDKGVAAIAPVDTSLSPEENGSYEIITMRVGEVVQWYARHVRIDLYNDKLGRRQEITLDKRAVALAENPFYALMNEPNSTLQRLTRALNYLDTQTAQQSSGKLDIIIQLPYVIKSDARREQAEQRRTDIEFQLKGSQYGIAYTDGTEKITQLNRPAENNLLDQIKTLTEQLYTQLGVTPEIMNGTADEAAMINYMNRTVEPIVTAIVEALSRSFLTKTAKTQNQAILFFKDPFKLVPVSVMAEISDKLTRNEILTSNEIRGVIGFAPSKDPKADELRNSNVPQANDTSVAPPPAPPEVDSSPSGSENQRKKEGDSQNGS